MGLGVAHGNALTPRAMVPKGGALPLLAMASIGREMAVQPGQVADNRYRIDAIDPACQRLNVLGTWRGATAS